MSLIQFNSEVPEEWCARHVLKGKPGHHIELKKRFNKWSSVVILVALNGWKYAAKKEVPDVPLGKREYYPNNGYGTKGCQVRMAMNGPLKMTMEEFEEIQEAVHEAYAILKNGQ